MAELDALDPVPDQVKLQSGTIVVFEDLRSRQFFRLLRIVTHGALPLIQDTSLLRLDPNGETGEFVERMLTLLLLSIPDAEEETILFVQSMVKPYGLIEGRRLNKADKERNDYLLESLDEELNNPDLDDLVTIVEGIVRREAKDIQALGKRLMAMFKLAEKTGQVPSSPNPTSPDRTSSADSREPSTSSPTSTDGPTTPSGTSPSKGSAKSSRRSANAASGADGSGSNG